MVCELGIRLCLHTESCDRGWRSPDLAFAARKRHERSRCSREGQDAASYDLAPDRHRARCSGVYISILRTEEVKQNLKNFVLTLHPERGSDVIEQLDEIVGSLGVPFYNASGDFIAYERAPHRPLFATNDIHWAPWGNMWYGRLIAQYLERHTGSDALMIAPAPIPRTIHQNPPTFGK